MGIKETLRNNATVYYVYRKWCEFFGHHFPSYFSKKNYKKIFKRSLDLELPQTLNEKLMYYKLKLYWENPLVATCADKLKVREYVTACGCEGLLYPLLGVWERVEDINWDSLPDRFVIKCNHGSGYNIICKDKSNFDTAKAEKELAKWMKEKYGYINAEQGIYSRIKSMIIAEKFIETPDELPPHDYKFFCSYGKVKLLFLACDRYDGKTKFDYYTPEWEWIPVRNAHPNKGPVEKPSNLHEMISYAEKLSKPFPLVRVDLYNVAGNVIFGELTFTHFGCIHRFDPDTYDLEFGKLFSDVYEADKIL